MTGTAEKLDLAGKDWLTVIEAAHYCGVSVSQFRQKASEYSLFPRNFMGRQLYEKAAIYAAIYGSQQWQKLTSSGEEVARTSVGNSSGRGSSGHLANLMPVRLRKFVPRKKRS